MNTTATAPRSRNEIVARVVSWMFVLGTAYFSASHIVGLSYANGLSTPEAFAAVPFIDGFGVLGRILRSLPSRKARRGGTIMMVVAGGVSLTANIAQGHTVGQKLFGILTVAGFVAAEWAVGLVKEAAAEIAQAPTAAAPQITAADVKAAVAAAVAAERAQAATDTQAAVKAAVDAALAKAERNRKAKERREAKAAEAAAPVSPAPAGPINSDLIVPTAAELRQLVARR